MGSLGKWLFDPPQYVERVLGERKDRSRNRNLPRVFVGADGEGVTNPRRHMIPVGEKGMITGRHEYRLLRVGAYALESEKDLTTWECLAFLADLPIGPLYVAYFFSYDVTMILRGLPRYVLKQMFRPEGTKGVMFRTWEVKGPDGSIYEIGHVPKKEFKVRRKGRPHYVVVQDVGTFFQAPFLSAIKQWEVGTKEEREVIRKGKEDRSIVTDIDGEVRYYNLLEIHKLEELMDDFRGVCKDVGYMPGKWEGPGNLASAVLGKHGIPRRKDLELSEELVSDATLGLHFGRFEAPMVGTIPGPLIEYDICSAYPYAMTLLPCLIHGKWHKRKGMPNEMDGISLVKGSFAHPARSVTCSLPVRRKDGSINYPRMGSGAWWSPEIREALKRGMDFNGIEHWTYERCCSCDPFGWIPDLYAERIRLGKSAKGMVLKLVLNSLYGKMAQTKGTAPWFNAIYAGLITSMTRSMLLDATNGDGEDVAMYATDAVYVRTPRTSLDLGRRLGEWEEAVHPEGMHVVQPGLYFGSKGDRVPKTRGLPRSAVADNEEAFRRAWRDLIADPWDFKGHRVEIPMRVFLGLKVAFHLNRPEHAGQWVDTVRSAGYDWRMKRGRPTIHEHEGGWYVSTEPLVGNGLVPSIPYTPAFRSEIEAKRVEQEWWRLCVDVDWGDIFEQHEEHWV